MAGRTSAGRAQATREENGLPKSMAALRLAVVGAIKHWRRLEATSFTEQHSRGVGDEEMFLPAERGGPVLSFADYRKALTEREKALKDSTPPAVWRLAAKRAEEELEQEAG